MSLNTQRTGQIGVNVVERIILHEWGDRWQPLSSVNDDGVDGLIFLEAKGRATGQVVYVQVKCYQPKLSKKAQHYRLAINSIKLKKNVEVWGRVIGAVILVYVDPITLNAFWVNVRDPRSRGQTQIFVPKANEFTAVARPAVQKLCGTLHKDQLLQAVHTKSSDFEYLKSSLHLQSSSRQHYRSLKRLNFNGSAADVTFSREGWHHIVRRSRPALVRFQSFQLLGCIKPILKNLKEEDLRKFVGSDDNAVGLVQAQALVHFTFRQTAVVSIIFRRRVDKSGQPNYSFHTIYEVRRNRDLLGLKELARSAGP